MFSFLLGLVVGWVLLPRPAWVEPYLVSIREKGDALLATVVEKVKKLFEKKDPPAPTSNTSA